MLSPQVGDLYGPLLACVTASKSAFNAMVRQHHPDGTYESFVKEIHRNPEGPEGRSYRWSDNWKRGVTPANTHA
jgi:hypothetical protein